MRRFSIILTLVLAACGAPAPTAVGPAEVDRAAPISAEDANGDFVLSIGADGAVFPAGKPIDIETTLTYAGVQPSVEIWGSGGGVVAFDVRQLDGDFHVEAEMTSDCAPHELRRGQSAQIEFQKSGAWDPQDPGSRDIQAFLADPLLRLPPGRWEITAWAVFLVGDCALPEVELRSSIIIATH